MSYAYNTCTGVVSGLFALSGSGAVLGSWVLVLVGAALVMPGFILTFCAKPRSSGGAITTSDEPALVVSAVRRRSSLDSGGFDVNRWANEGCGPWRAGA